MRFDLVMGDLNFPTSLTFDASGVAYVAESGLPFGGAASGGQIWRIDRSGRRTLLARDLRPPVNGLTWHTGNLYISEGGDPACISRLDTDGTRTTILQDLPGPGNYHTNMMTFGPDGKLYFSQGAMTNAGIVGLDAYELGWLRRLPHAHDIPGYAVTLTGVNVETPNPLANGAAATAVTGAFVPFGTPTREEQRMGPSLPCTAAVMRCDAKGNNLELVAWGLRNAYGLGFHPDGRLLALDQGADDRGSRPIGNAPDLLFDVRPGAWYGWPDFIGGDPVTDPRYRPARGPAPSFLLANHAELPRPETALVRFPPHVAATKFAVAPPGSPWTGDLLVALFGDEAPMTAPAGPRRGRSVARVSLDDACVHPLPLPGLRRPIDVQFHPQDHSLHILDFGLFEMSADGVVAEARTGKLWRLVEDGGG